MTTESFTLFKDGSPVASGPLALVAPQAALLAGDQNVVRLVVVDGGANAARIQVGSLSVQARWEPTLELFPAQSVAPSWIRRLQLLLDDLATS